MARAVASPMDLGDGPVTRTGVVPPFSLAEPFLHYCLLVHDRRLGGEKGRACYLVLFLRHHKRPRPCRRLQVKRGRREPPFPRAATDEWGRRDVVQMTDDLVDRRLAEALLAGSEQRPRETEGLWTRGGTNDSPVLPRIWSRKVSATWVPVVFFPKVDRDMLC